MSDELGIARVSRALVSAPLSRSKRGAATSFGSMAATGMVALPVLSDNPKTKIAKPSCFVYSTRARDRLSNAPRPVKHERT